MLKGGEENWNLSFTKSSDCSEPFVFSLNVSSGDQCQQFMSGILETWNIPTWVTIHILAWFPSLLGDLLFVVAVLSHEEFRTFLNISLVLIRSIQLVARTTVLILHILLLVGPNMNLCFFYTFFFGFILTFETWGIILMIFGQLFGSGSNMWWACLCVPGFLVLSLVENWFLSSISCILPACCDDVPTMFKEESEDTLLLMGCRVAIMLVAGFINIRAAFISDTRPNSTQEKKIYPKTRMIVYSVKERTQK